MCDGSTAGVRGVVAYIGTYFVPEHNTARSQSPNRARRDPPATPCPTLTRIRLGGADQRGA
jgi:hypothetical protein